MNKSKLKWKYAHEDYTIEVRLDNPTELRVCAYGYDDEGNIRSTLYCTCDGRFMQRTADGWMELKPNTCPANLKKKSGKGSVYPRMRNFNNLQCHLLVCSAWQGLRPEGCECDHINGSNLDWSAVNLRWVTRAENIRCGRYLKRLRKHGIDPKRITYSLLLELYALPWVGFEQCLRLFDAYCNTDPSPLLELAIEVNLQRAYMKLLNNTNHVNFTSRFEP